MISMEVRRAQDGHALQVLHHTQCLLCHGQTVTERAVTLALLRRGKAHPPAPPKDRRWSTN